MHFVTLSSTERSRLAKIVKAYILTPPHAGSAHEHAEVQLQFWPANCPVCNMGDLVIPEDLRSHLNEHHSPWTYCSKCLSLMPGWTLNVHQAACKSSSGTILSAVKACYGKVTCMVVPEGSYWVCELRVGGKVLVCTQATGRTGRTTARYKALRQALVSYVRNRDAIEVTADAFSVTYYQNAQTERIHRKVIQDVPKVPQPPRAPQSPPDPQTEAQRQQALKDLETAITALKELVEVYIGIGPQRKRWSALTEAAKQALEATVLPQSKIGQKRRILEMLEWRRTAKEQAYQNAGLAFEIEDSEPSALKEGAVVYHLERHFVGVIAGETWEPRIFENKRSKREFRVLVTAERVAIACKASLRRVRPTGSPYISHCWRCPMMVGYWLERCEACGWFICLSCAACGCEYNGPVYYRRW